MSVKICSLAIPPDCTGKQSKYTVVLRFLLGIGGNITLLPVLSDTQKHILGLLNWCVWGRRELLERGKKEEEEEGRVGAGARGGRKVSWMFWTLIPLMTPSRILSPLPILVCGYRYSFGSYQRPFGLLSAFFTSGCVGCDSLSDPFWGGGGEASSCTTGFFIYIYLIWFSYVFYLYIFIILLVLF